MSILYHPIRDNNTAIVESMLTGPIEPDIINGPPVGAGNPRDVILSPTSLASCLLPHKASDKVDDRGRVNVCTTDAAKLFVAKFHLTAKELLKVFEPQYSVLFPFEEFDPAYLRYKVDELVGGDRPACSTTM